MSAKSANWANCQICGRDITSLIEAEIAKHKNRPFKSTVPCPHCKHPVYIDAAPASQAEIAAMSKRDKAWLN